MCKGQCPGTAIDRDWRNRTDQCGAWMGILEVLEEELIAAGELPLSRSPRRGRVEEALLAVWARGETASLHSLLEGLSIEGSAPATSV